MKKLVVVLAVLMMMLAGCGTAETKKSSEQPKTEETKKQQVTVNITKDNGKEKVTEKKVAIKENDTVMDVMKSNFKLDLIYNDAFINGIDGVKGNEQDKTSWFLSVNGKDATKGAKDIKVKPGDVIGFDLHKYE
ncbi:DUF4430 domain-containing protein [Fictibacillus barbaricus]|uniref:Uncharacterized protein YceK n=1 Tax=Fictibacillus barbaricus TaxID=182136 RepID=A0ABU1TZE4_9BACL|nr:DUF4430 domain-containing protein [Fictibacillus barbaricus]MDR7072585.1 uncharacterized protein YceK [Fictibacillus barbaricus]